MGFKLILCGLVSVLEFLDYHCPFTGSFLYMFPSRSCWLNADAQQDGPEVTLGTS